MQWRKKWGGGRGGAVLNLECSGGFFVGGRGGGGRGVTRLRKRAKDGGHAVFGNGNHAAAKL